MSGKKEIGLNPIFALLKGCLFVRLEDIWFIFATIWREICGFGEGLEGICPLVS